jgi:parvulin-like peptidyl-prolyl isomerase
MISSSPELGGLSPDVLRQLAHRGLLRPFIRAECMEAAVDQEPLTEEEVQHAKALFAREQQLTDQAAVQRYAQAQLLSPAALEATALRPARQFKFSQREFAPKAEARFLQRKAQLDRVVYSLLRLQDAGLARELYLRLEEGEANFADLAAEFAEGPEKATRGIVGPVPLTQAHPTLAERLRTASPGVVLEPFRIESWWLVVRLESLTPASFDAATAARMAQELFEQWIGEQVERRLAELRPLLQIGVSPDANPTAGPSPS